MNPTPTMTLDQWLVNMKPSIWENLDKKQRLETLQQLENIMAKEQGRQPLKISIIGRLEQKLMPGVAGYCTKDGIALSYRYFEGKKSRLKSSDYSFADAINTILHEGRHAWQNHIRLTRPSDADPALLALLDMNNAMYFRQPEEAYSAQVIELDARRYARKQFDCMLERMKALGMAPDDAFYKYRSEELSREYLEALSMESRVSGPIFDYWNKAAYSEWEKKNPEMAHQADMEKLSLFEDAEKLERGEISLEEYANGELLALSYGENTDVRVKKEGAVFLEEAFWAALGRPDRAKPEAEKPDGFSVRPVGRGNVF